jgi:hypothetical protein
MTRLLIIAFVILFLAPIGVSFAVTEREPGVTWQTARRDATGLAPDPKTTPEAVVQVYAARAFAWRGIFSVHTWIVMKPPGATEYTRYEVMGFGVQHGSPAVRLNRMGPDNYWFGNYPTVILDRRGPEVEPLIARIMEAINTYPHKDMYRTWPGPNSNTFIAHIGRSVPELGLEMPGNAIGKDFLTDGAFFGAAPSGSGYQVSLLGLAGVMLALNEGIEINLLGLSFGIDFDDLSVKLPALGRIGAAPH